MGGLLARWQAGYGEEGDVHTGVGTQFEMVLKMLIIMLMMCGLLTRQQAGHKGEEGARYRQGLELV